MNSTGMQVVLYDVPAPPCNGSVVLGSPLQVVLHDVLAPPCNGSVVLGSQYVLLDIPRVSECPPVPSRVRVLAYKGCNFQTYSNDARKSRRVSRLLSILQWRRFQKIAQFIWCQKWEPRDSCSFSKRFLALRLHSFMSFECTLTAM